MAKGLLCITLAACLLFQASAQLPLLGNLLGGSGSGSAGGSASGSASGSVSVDGSASGSLLGGLLPNINGLLPNIPGLLSKTNAAIANITQTATGSLNNLNKAVVNLQNVLSTITINSATTAVSTSTQVVQEVINQAKNAAGGTASPAVSACISKAQTSLNALAPQAINTVVNCSSNIGKEATSLALQVAAFDIGLKTDLVQAGIKSVLKCTTSLSIEKCLDTVLKELTNYANGQINKINKAIATTQSLTTAAGKCTSSGTDLVNKTGQVVVTQLRSCLSGQGLELPNIVPNFSFYLNRAKKAIENITSSAFGPNSPINKLNKAVVNLQKVVATVTANSATITVKSSIKIFQEFINQAKIAASGSINPAVGACISTAQTSFNNIAPQAINRTVSCSVNIGKDAAKLAVQSAEFDIGLKTDLLLAITKALAKCSFQTLDNKVIEKCFDAAVTEVENYFNSQINKINKAIATAESLTVEAGRCTSAGADFAEKSGQAVVTQLRACLNGQGVSVQTFNNTAELKAGKAAIAEVAVNLNGSLEIVSTASFNAELSVQFFDTINVVALVSGYLDSAESVVLDLEGQLKSNTNPAVKACIDSAKSQLASFRTSATADLTNCVKINKDKAIAYANQISAQLLALKYNLGNASVEAEKQCSISIGANKTKECFADYELKLNVDVQQAINDAQTVSNNAQQLIKPAIDCVNTELAQLNASIDSEFASLTSCLAAQGVNVTISRTS